MGILDRVTKLLKTTTTLALAPAPDPRVTHLTSHQKQRALLAQVVTASKEVTAAKERLRTTADGVKAKLPAMEEQARQELKAGRETMARLALQRRQVVMNELQTLEAQLAAVEREESALAMIEQRLAGQIEAFAARQEVIKARYSAAEAQVRISEAMTGVSQDFADLTATLQRAEQTTEDMQARATAIDRLVREGDLEAISFGPGSDAIDARFETLGSDADVERQLAALRGPSEP
ncbi:MAG TPA: PspA/IM30 family protein [Candidatus Dormibacteraeota bacterium]|nr:PspA/IM30 family protein [Candidatus Dormibacteraeota bacterium]